jgi:hypothetical protein
MIPWTKAAIEPIETGRRYCVIQVWKGKKRHPDRYPGDLDRALDVAREFHAAGYRVEVQWLAGDEPERLTGAGGRVE